MSGSLIANRYAKALFSLTSSSSEQSITLGYLKLISEMFLIPEVRKIFKSPVMPIELKQDLLNYAQQKSNANDIAKSFSQQILSAGRANLLPEVCAAFQNLVNLSSGVETGFFTTASSASADVQADLESKLSKLFKKRLSLTNKVDPKILGGTIIQVGNFAVDLSVKSKLEQAADYALLESGKQ